MIALPLSVETTFVNRASSSINVVIALEITSDLPFHVRCAMSGKAVRQSTSGNLHGARTNYVLFVQSHVVDQDGQYTRLAVGFLGNGDSLIIV